MPIRSTRTYVTLSVSKTAFREIRARLEAAGYPVGDEAIDMHGLALTELPSQGAEIDVVNDAAESSTIEVASILSQRTRAGMVEFTLNSERTQMDLAKAREVASMLQSAIEAATSDQIVWKFLTEQLALTDEQASAALLSLRELRQGSKSTVYPN